MSKNQYLYLFPRKEVLEAINSTAGKSFANSHSEYGFTPKEDIILKAGEPVDISLWHSTTQKGSTQIQITIKPFVKKESSEAPV